MKKHLQPHKSETIEHLEQQSNQKKKSKEREKRKSILFKFTGKFHGQ